MRCPHCNEVHDATAGGVCPFTSLPIGVTGVVGTLLAGRYRVLQLLGVGGMGEVYECEDVEKQRRVCLKRLLPKFRSQPILRARFEREAAATMAITHPNVVAVYDLGVAEDGIPFFVMPRLVGETLAQTMEREGVLEVDRACTLVSQVLLALEAAHASHIIHRDLKPDNVFLARDGDGNEQVKLLDFGLSRVEDQAGARISLAGVLLGTASYASPEQALGKRDVDHRTDLWAVGVMLYELLSGELPFTEATPAALIARIEHAPPPKLAERCPDVPDGLSRVIERALARDPAQRFPTARAFRDAIAPWTPGARTVDESHHARTSDVPPPTQLAAAGPIEAPAAATEKPPWTPRRMTVAALMVLAAAAFVAWFTWFPAS